MIPFSTVEKIRRDIPHAEVSEMRDAGHSPMYEQPSEFAGIVADFCFRVNTDEG
jgi:pimeloyl-ACP methyl ester carboxylesterase